MDRAIEAPVARSDESYRIRIYIGREEDFSDTLSSQLSAGGIR